MILYATDFICQHFFEKYGNLFVLIYFLHQNRKGITMEEYYKGTK